MAEQYTRDDLFQYDSDQISLTWINQELSDAFPEAAGVVSISWDNPSFELLPDGLGGWVYRRWKNTSGTCQVTLHGAHPINQRLIATVAASRQTGVIINGPLYLNDQWNKQKILMDGAVPVNYPDPSRGSGIGQNLWVFRFGGSKIVPNLGRVNQVA